MLVDVSLRLWPHDSETSSESLSTIDRFAHFTAAELHPCLAEDRGRVDHSNEIVPRFTHKIRGGVLTSDIFALVLLLLRY
jgi:hypothetical protein